MKAKCLKCKDTYEAEPYEIRNDELCPNCAYSSSSEEATVSKLQGQTEDTYQCPLCSKQVSSISAKSLYGHRVCQLCRINFATRRQAAFLIDWYVIYLFCVILWSSSNDFIEFLGVITLSLFLIKDGFKGYSLGKGLLGLQVINEEDGEPIGLFRSLKRNLPTMLPIPLYRFFLGFQLFDGYRNGDGWAQTKVVWKKYSSHPIFQPKCSPSFIWTEEIKQKEGERRLSYALKKEIKGDWDEAIRLYNKIIIDFPDTEIANDASVSLKSLKERTESNSNTADPEVLPETTSSHTIYIQTNKSIDDVLKKAETGDARAQFELGVRYANGIGVIEDDNVAVKWLKMAAVQGNSDAQLLLGIMHVNDHGIEKNFVEVVKWPKTAAEQGDALAQYYLGLWYANGEGVPEDDKEAVKWYTKAAEQGLAEAQFSLGWMYANSEGVIKDDKEAVKWYRKAAEQDYAKAQYNLGWMYANGEGVIEDDKEAFKWYRKAAEQGLPDAQFNLGVMYAKGQGVIEDYVEAYKWALLAGMNGEDVSNFKAMLKYCMTASQIAEAHRLVKEFVAQKGKQDDQTNQLHKKRI